MTQENGFRIINMIDTQRGKPKLNCSQVVMIPQNSVAVISVLFSDNTLLFCGGINKYGTTSKACYKHDRVKKKWDLFVDFTRVRFNSTSVLINNTHWWVLGGKDENTTEIYNHQEKSVSFSVNLPSLENYEGLKILKLNRTHFVLVDPYFSFFLFDFSSEKWKPLPKSANEMTWVGFAGIAKKNDGDPEVRFLVKLLLALCALNC